MIWGMRGMMRREKRKRVVKTKTRETKSLRRDVVRASRRKNRRRNQRKRKKSLAAVPVALGWRPHRRG